MAIPYQANVGGIISGTRQDTLAKARELCTKCAVSYEAKFGPDNVWARRAWDKLYESGRGRERETERPTHREK